MKDDKDEMPLFDDWCPPCNRKCEQGRKCPDVPQSDAGSGFIWEVLAGFAFFAIVFILCFI